MAKTIQDIQMGDHTITLKDYGEGQLVARLSSGRYGELLEIERTGEAESGEVPQIEIGDARVSMEHLALMTILLDVDQDLIKEINRINKVRNPSKHKE